MEENEFIKKMDELKKPDFAGKEPNKKLKLAIINSKRSGALGVWFLLVPCYFLFMIVMKYYFNVNLHVIDIFEDFIASLDKSPLTKFIAPLFFVGFPIAGIVMNLLSVMFFEYDKKQKQINMSIKLKPLNILIVIISVSVLSIFALYLITENLHP